MKTCLQLVVFGISLVLTVVFFGVFSFYVLDFGNVFLDICDSEEYIFSRGHIDKDACIESETNFGYTIIAVVGVITLGLGALTGGVGFWMYRSFKSPQKNQSFWLAGRGSSIFCMV